jgi:hypothetical protein
MPRPRGSWWRRRNRPGPCPTRSTRARLNIIKHILDTVPHKKLPREKIELPKRQKPGDYQDSHYPFRFIAEVY